MSSQPQPIDPKRIAIISAEFKGLAQRGGLGDVVRDLSLSLAERDKDISVILPYYDIIESPATPVSSLKVDFAGKVWQIGIYSLNYQGLTVYLMRSDYFFGGEYGDVYVDSSKKGRGPFEDDAKRFAFFSTAALDFLTVLHNQKPFQVLHAHDWHTGSMFLSLNFDPKYRQLAREIKTVFTIHNLDYQGVRPFNAQGTHNLISYSEWFPGIYKLLQRNHYLKKFSHPGASEPCFNFMRTAIQLADSLNTVSPAYAREILKADDAASGFLGGRGLEKDLRRAHRQGRLHGILNGIDYREFDPSRMAPAFDADTQNFSAQKEMHKAGLLSLLNRKLREIPNLAHRQQLMQKISQFSSTEWMGKPLVVLCSRMASQKVSLLIEPSHNSGTSTLDRILNNNINAIFLGRGELEEKMSDAVNKRDNGIMIAGFDSQLEKDLYSAGDIFLMPSDFEPCGVSQMKAMRFGCLPVVHHIGGLKDTVVNEENGFSFRGNERSLRTERFISAVDKAVKLRSGKSSHWMRMQKKAMQARFDWATSTGKYLDLYKRTNALSPSAA